MARDDYDDDPNDRDEDDSDDAPDSVLAKAAEVSRIIPIPQVARALYEIRKSAAVILEPVRFSAEGAPLDENDIPIPSPAVAYDIAQKVWTTLYIQQQKGGNAPRRSESRGRSRDSSDRGSRRSRDDDRSERRRGRRDDDEDRPRRRRRDDDDEERPRRNRPAGRRASRSGGGGGRGAADGGKSARCDCKHADPCWQQYEDHEGEAWDCGCDPDECRAEGQYDGPCGCIDNGERVLEETDKGWRWMPKRSSSSRRRNRDDEDFD